MTNPKHLSWNHLIREFYSPSFGQMLSRTDALRLEIQRRVDATKRRK